MRNFNAVRFVFCCQFKLSIAIPEFQSLISKGKY